MKPSSDLRLLHKAPPSRRAGTAMGLFLFGTVICSSSVATEGSETVRVAANTGTYALVGQILHGSRRAGSAPDNRRPRGQTETAVPEADEDC